MDYTKSGGVKLSGKEARFIDKSASGKKNPPGGRASREDVLARLKAVAEARAASKDGKDGE